MLWVSGRYDLLIEVVCETRSAFQTFSGTALFRPLMTSIRSKSMSGIEMFKNQFLLKRQAQ